MVGVPNKCISCAASFYALEHALALDTLNLVLSEVLALLVLVIATKLVCNVDLLAYMVRRTLRARQPGLDQLTGNTYRRK